MRLTKLTTDVGNRSLAGLIIFLVALFLFTYHLGPDVFINFNVRFAQFAQDMLNNGISFFPTLHSVPYPDYPVLPITFIYWLSLPVGHLTQFTAILPSALAAALTLSFTYHIGALVNRRWGLLAVLFLCLTWHFLSAARHISLDLYVTLTTTVIFYLCFKAYLQRRYPNSLLLLGLLLFGIACRGPIGAIIPSSVAVLFAINCRNLRLSYQIIAVTLLALGIGIATLLTAAWYVGGYAFLIDVIHMQFIARLQDSAKNPFYFYFINSLGTYALSYPIAMMILLTELLSAWRQPSTPTVRLLQSLFLWVLIILLGMSFPHDKKPRYILSIAPALALISAYIFSNELFSPVLKKLRTIVHSLCTLLPAIAMGLLEILRMTMPLFNITLVLPSTLVTCLLLIIVFTLLLSYRLISKKNHEILALSGAVLTLLIITWFIVEPLLLELSH